MKRIWEVSYHNEINVFRNVPPDAEAHVAAVCAGYRAVGHLVVGMRIRLLPAEQKIDNGSMM